MDNFNERTKFAIDIAIKAGQEIKKIYDENDLQVKDKGLNDVITIADTASEKTIIEGIKEIFPFDIIISEEIGEIRNDNNSEYTWVIDPLDGTVNYSTKIPFWCVSVGCMKNNKPICGAVYVPCMNMLFVTEKGKGAYLNGDRISVSSLDKIQDAIISINFNKRYPDLLQEHNDVYCKLMNIVRNTVKPSSVVINLCFTASGKFDGFYDSSTYLWDICVGSLLIEEAGGIITDKYGDEIDYTKHEGHSIITCNREIYSKLKDTVD